VGENRIDCDPERRSPMATLTLPDTDGRPITEEQFEKLPELDGFYFELDDGNLRLINNVTTDWHSVMIHTLVSYFMGIGKFAVAERLVRLRPGRIPRCDVGVLIAPPDLSARISTRDATQISIIVEVVSKDYRDEDWVRKMREYAEANVPRYWIVDEHPTDPADAIVHMFINRGGRFEPESEVELSKLVESA
jgi:Uma2 family endonuclease